MNRDLINKNSTVIRLGTCTVNVLSVVKYHIVKVLVVELVIQLHSKTTYSRTSVYTNFFICSDVKKTLR